MAAQYGVNWDQVNEQLKRHWGLLTDADLSAADGNFEKLVGIVQLKTGRPKEEVESFIQESIEEFTSMTGRLGSIATESATDGYRTVEAFTQRNPMESVAMAFGAGLLAGVTVAFLLPGD